MSGGPSHKLARATLASLVSIGAALRVCAALFDRPLIPDEYFQYLEPAWWHLTGAGIAVWEWHEGLRSWALPSFNGACMALGMALGVRDGGWLTTLVRLQWALINTGMVLVAWRGGSSLARVLQRGQAPDDGREGGLLAAALCAGFGLLVVYGGHAVSELPSMLCLVAGLVSCAELCEAPRDERSARSLRKAAWSGALLSLGACLRIANGPLTLLAPLWLLCTRRFRALLVLLGAALVPALAFGLLDLFTWGSFAGSFVNYVKFNFIQGGAVRFGTEGDTFYLSRLWETLPFGLPLLALAALGGVRASWPYLVSALALIGYLSREPHKEARFILAFWPYLLIAAGGALGAWIARARARAGGHSFVRGAPLARLVAVVVTLIVLADSARNTHRDHWVDADRVAAHAWLGHQPDVTGVLLEWPTGTAGGMALNSPAPQLMFDPAVLSNPLISHVVAREDTREERLSLAAGFAEVHREQTFLVLARR